MGTRGVRCGIVVLTMCNLTPMECTHTLRDEV